MRSAFLVFDLVGRNAGLKRERDARGFIHPKFDHGEEAVGLVVREGVRLVPAGKALKCHFSFGRTWSCTEVILAESYPRSLAPESLRYSPFWPFLVT